MAKKTSLAEPEWSEEMRREAEAAKARVALDTELAPKCPHCGQALLEGEPEFQSR